MVECDKDILQCKWGAIANAIHTIIYLGTEKYKLGNTDGAKKEVNDAKNGVDDAKISMHDAKNDAKNGAVDAKTPNKRQCEIIG